MFKLPIDNQLFIGYNGIKLKKGGIIHEKEHRFQAC
jgi:hypothetical protein